jgi:hypothetical protein
MRLELRAELARLQRDERDEALRGHLAEQLGEQSGTSKAGCWADAGRA